MPSGDDPAERGANHRVVGRRIELELRRPGRCNPGRGTNQRCLGGVELDACRSAVREQRTESPRHQQRLALGGFGGGHGGTNLRAPGIEVTGIDPGKHVARAHAIAFPHGDFDDGAHQACAQGRARDGLGNTTHREVRGDNGVAHDVHGARRPRQFGSRGGRVRIIGGAGADRGGQQGGKGDHARLH